MQHRNVGTGARSGQMFCSFHRRDGRSQVVNWLDLVQRRGLLENVQLGKFGDCCDNLKSDLWLNTIDHLSETGPVHCW